MKSRIVVLGAGFGGLELCTLVSEALGDSVEVTLIDQAEAFVFGFSKLDVMFGHATPESVYLPYREFVKPGVRLLRETITAIDPAARRVTTDRGAYQADLLVVALGADYDFAATPGLIEGRDEFYSVAGAERLREVLPSFTRGPAIVGGCGAPFKCPPAPSECALMLHDYLTERGVRAQCEITLVLPLPSPVPPSPETSRALVAAFAERGIRFLPNRRVATVDHGRQVAVLDDGTELPFALFLGIPKHCLPPVVAASALAEDGWVPANPKTLETRYPGVYAVGDVASVGVPKAGVFSEGAARVVAQELIARAGKGEPSAPYAGKGSCYIEFGGGRIARVDVDFYSGPKPTGAYYPPSSELRAEKKAFGASRRARWFGRRT
jgi:sulfide:quinone oxidoreductase